ncbi:LysR substrate-binding domain-containing protein [Caballeronia ptereochthonis]|uniref:LysR substrate-binding domain-containing protein n=1 Tax=Caballeronia ptereochthonis TaxID=1777144 RepID=UPI0031344AFC
MFAGKLLARRATGRSDRAFRCRSSKAVREGAGVALLPGLLVAPDLAAGRLAMLGLEAGPPVELWTLYSSRRLLSAKVRAFLDMLQGVPDGNGARRADTASRANASRTFPGADR